jgi:hypothetical protein
MYGKLIVYTLILSYGRKIIAFYNGFVIAFSPVLCRNGGAAARVDELFDVSSVLVNWDAQLFSRQDIFTWTSVARALALLPCREAMKTVLIVSDFFGVYMVFLIFYTGLLPGCKTARI